MKYGWPGAIALSLIAGFPTHELSAMELKATGYFIREESEFDGKPKVADILTRGGAVIARVSAEFKRALDIEGSGKLNDGRVVSNAGTVKGVVRYRVSPFRAYGRTATGCPAIPWRTVAVDPKLIPLRTVLYLRQTEGMKLPDGSKHDGYWVANDTGGAIKGQRVDLFIGSRKQARAAGDYGIRKLPALDARLMHRLPEGKCSR